MITGEKLKQLLDLYLEFLEYLAHKDNVSKSAASLAKLRVAEHSFNFLLDSAVNTVMDDMNDHDLKSLGGSEENKNIRIERDRIAALITEKVKAISNGKEVYNACCDELKL